MGAKLNFYGKEVQIIFTDGTESIFYELKEDALHAIIDCYKKKKITEKELLSFKHQIAYSEMKSNLENINLVFIYKQIREAVFVMSGLAPTEAQKN